MPEPANPYRSSYGFNVSPADVWVIITALGSEDDEPWDERQAERLAEATARLRKSFDALPADERERAQDA